MPLLICPAFSSYFPAMSSTNSGPSTGLSISARYPCLSTPTSIIPTENCLSTRAGLQSEMSSRGLALHILALDQGYVCRHPSACWDLVHIQHTVLSISSTWYFVKASVLTVTLQLWLFDLVWKPHLNKDIMTWLKNSWNREPLERWYALHIRGSHSLLLHMIPE
jgi:hypothetical protein